jgi:hypothetical protein
MIGQFNHIGFITVFAGLCILADSSVSAGERETVYRATTVEPVNGTKIANETPWRCKDGRCVAQQANSSIRNVCAQLARKVGRIESFSFRGSLLDADALAKCNSKAR